MRRLWIVFGCLVTLCLMACNARTAGADAQTEVVQAVAADVAQVYYFHGKQRCVTCNAIERLTREVVDSLANGKVVMRIVDISNSENDAVVDRYEVTWSALILDRGGRVENLTDMAFSYAKGQPELFKAKLVESIQEIER